MEKINILVVGGHPADVFDTCGGTMAHHVRRGDNVTTLALTNGVRIHDVVISEEMRFQKERPDPERLEKIIQERCRVKYAEVVKACGILGVTDVRFLSYDDSVLLVTSEMVSSVARVIRSVKPDIVITHYPIENGGAESHHGNTGKIVLHALQYAGSVDFNDNNTSHRVPQVYFISPAETNFKGTCLSGSTPGYCDYFVDISDVADLVVKALDAMRSQQYNGNYAKRCVEVTSGKEGFYMSVPYAEGFYRYYPEIGDYLTVSKERRERANEHENGKLERMSRMVAPVAQLDEYIR